MLRWMIPLTSSLLVAAPAAGQQLGSIDFFVFLELEDCFEGKRGSCSRAAEGMANAGWKAHLLGTGEPSGASNDALRLARHLACASGASGACMQLAKHARKRRDNLASAIWTTRACRLGDGSACERFELALDRSLDYNELLRTPNPVARRDYGLTAAAPPTADSLTRLATACDRSDAPDACLALAGAYNTQRVDNARRTTTESHIAEACRRNEGGSACALQRHIDQPDLVVDPTVQDAASIVREACSQGSVERACMLYAKLLDSGRALSDGHHGSRQYYGYACDGGAQNGCTRLTDAFRSGLAPGLEGECLSLRGGGAGDPRACTSTHTMRTFGVGLAQDKGLATQLKAEACDLGDHRPCVWLGNAAWADDKKSAYGWYQKACRAGDAVSCGVVGRMQIKGEGGVVKDLSAGIADLRRGCDLAGGNACFELGFAHSKGDRGVRQNSSTAARLYARSCSLGYANGCSSLGVLYLDGRGVTRNAGYAKYLLRRTCERGFGSACRNLGNVYRDALAGVKVDKARARWAYQRGCEADHSDSCARLEALGKEGPTRMPERGVKPASGLILERRAPSAEATRPTSRPTATGEDSGGSGDGPSYSYSRQGEGYGLGWYGTEVVVSNRDSEALGLDTERFASTRFTYLGIDMGFVLGEIGGWGMRAQLGGSFDVAGAIDDKVSNSPRFGGMHLEANLDLFYGLGDDFQVALALGWHGMSGPITMNSSIAGSLMLIQPPDDGFGWLFRATPLQLLAANERQLLSPLAIEVRALFEAVSVGVEFQYIEAPDADTEDIEAEAWGLLLRFGTGLGG